MKTSVREIDGALEIDTTPPGTAPDDALSFTGDDDEGGDAGWQEDLDEPWDEFDEEGEDPDEAPLVTNFTGVDLEDDSTFERWLQSGLKALVDPSLVVDGALGRRSRQAIKRFQSRAHELRGRGPRLSVDGVPGPKTVEALEGLTESEAPERHEGEPEPEPAPEPEQEPELEPEPAPEPEPEPATLHAAADGDGIVVREETRDGVTTYVISSGGDEVSFAYWTKDYRNYKPYSVSRYRGAKKGLVADATILAAGYSKSELGILRANSLKESGGTFGAINTWDNQILSWGMAQFAGHAGTLAVLLASLKEDERSAAAYRRWFSDNGIDVDYGEYPWKRETKKGWHVVVRADGETFRGDDGWEAIRRRPRLIGAFLLAGNDPAIALGQILFWRSSFLSRAIRKIIGKDKKAGRAGARALAFMTAERSLALIVRLNNWMPAYVVKWCDRFLAEYARDNPDAKVYDPKRWDQTIEDWMAERIMKERREVKRGDYDDYALDLSRRRGTFVVGSDE